MGRRLIPEPVTPVRLLFKGQTFATAPGVYLSWEALSVGMEAINARHDTAPLRRSRAAAVVAAALLITACGGGGSDDDEPKTKTIDPPNCAASAASCA